MQRKLFLALFLAAFVPTLVFAAGKIRGKVTDAGTGEPLVGANVVIVGSQMGAATNIAGEYIILNVPVGTYTLKTSYVGYQSITVSNVRVNADLTSEQNFALPGEGVTVAQVEIVAERPLVNKSATNAVRIVDSEFFDKIPARGVNAAIVAQPGVVTQGGQIYIRGGRPDEVGYRVEGVSGTDVVYGGNAIYTTAEAIEQLQVQAGGFSAEFGNANAGIVQSQLKTGDRDRWKASLLVETDNYTKQNKQSLSGYSYGYSDWTATFGGPITEKTLRFFGSAQNTFQRDRNVSVRDPYTLKNFVTDPVKTPAHLTAAPDTIPLMTGGGNTLGGMDKRWAFAGTLVADLNQLQLRAAGSYSAQTWVDGSWYTEQFNRSRLPKNDAQNGFANLKASYIFSPTTFLEVNGNFFMATGKTYDPAFGEDVFSYGDSLANAKLGYPMYANGQNFSRYTFFNGAGLALSQPGRQLAGYGKNRQTSIGGRADFTTQTLNHEIKVGGEYTRYTIRRYNPAGVIGWAQLKNQATSPSQLEDLLNKSSGVGSDIIGYDILGNELSDDVIKNNGVLYFGPRHPVFAALYLQDKIEFSDIILNLGLRWDYIDPNSVDTKNPANLAFNAQDLILASYYQATSKTSQVSPRIGFSFPVSDRTVFHAQYGKFIQQSRLNDSYRGAAQMSGNIKSGLWNSTPNGWGLLPERTTQYELGFSQVLSENSSIDITAFYKDIRDQIQFQQIAPDPSLGSEAPVYSSIGNTDFSTAKGVEFKFTLRRTNRLSAQFNYTFMDARSTASDPTSSNGIWQLGIGADALPKFVLPTNFNYAHSGTVVLDYRYGKNDGGPILSQLGANVLFRFNSGHSFTRVAANSSRGPRPGDARFRDALEPPGSSTTPWYFQLDMRLDKAVTIAMLDVDFYIYVVNLLGTDNPVDAFIRTGDTKDDGWFSSPGGQTDVQTLGPKFVEMYSALQLGRNSGNFGPPRQIRFGLKLEL
jgi:hypothetical protein